jgi:hypothetical protein
MPDANSTRDQQRQLREAQINHALGVFTLFFGLVIWVAIPFTGTTIGKLTNLAAGGVIGLIGAFLMYRARCVKKPR